LPRQIDSSFYNANAAGKKYFETAATCFKNLRLIYVRFGVKPGKEPASRNRAQTKNNQKRLLKTYKKEDYETVHLIHRYPAYDGCQYQLIRCKE
jgi:hypothetical protein